MKYYIIILVCFISKLSLSQTPSVVSRSSDVVVASDGGLITRNTLRPPVYNDTTAANSASFLLDSCGRSIFTYSDNSYWIRACNPKRWIKLLKTGDVASSLANNGLSKNGDTVQFGQTVNAVGNPAALNNSREIPLNGYNIGFSGTGTIGIGTAAPATTSKLAIIASGTTRGINITSATGTGINISSTNQGIEAQVSGATSTAIAGSTTGGAGSYGIQGSGGIGGTGGRFYTIAAGSDASPVALELERLPTGGGVTNGAGFTVMFRNSFTNGTSGNESGRIANYFSNAVSGTQTSAFGFHLMNNAVSARKALLSGNGQWTWDGYPALTAQVDSTTYKPIAIDASGNVVPMANWVGSGGGASNNTNIGTGFPWLNEGTQEIKTVANSNTITWDSTSTSNSLTAKADTSVLATQYDLTQITSGINQLTGDVIAGPGAGSQVATIAGNVVTDAKFRQSVGTSIVGKSTTGTGNVADIVSAIASTYLKRNSTIILWDSIDFAELKNVPDIQNPGVYFSPAEAFDPSFVVFASGIAKTDNAYSPGVAIQWSLLDNTTDHNSSFYDSVTGSGSGIGIRFPTVKNVLNTTITPDETFASYMVSLGSTTAINGLGSPVIRPAVLNIKLTGNGTSSWGADNGLGLASRWSLSTFSTGGTSLNITGVATTIDYPGMNIQYIGTNNYHIRRQYSGLGIYNVRFYLVDEFGNDVTDNPTSNDEVVITAGAMAPFNTNMATWSTDNQFMDGFANFWVFGAYECWLVAAPISSTSINVRWQTTYPSATNYKIYRATSLYGSRTLIHTGTEGSFTDSGLSSGTLYWYFMIAVIGGVDTEITYFRTSTND